MNPVEEESPLSRAIAVILYYFRSDKENQIPEGAVQKALTIAHEGLKQDISPGEISHTYQGGMIGGLNKITSKYYEVKPVRSGKAGQGVRYVFEPNVDIIEQDMKRKVFLDMSLPRYAKPMSLLFKTKGGVDNLTFVSLFLKKDAGFYELGNGLHRAIEEVKRLVFTKIGFQGCSMEIEQYIQGVGRKINLLEFATEYYKRITNVSLEDPDAKLVLSLAGFIPSEEEDLRILIRIFRRLRDEVKDISEVAREIRKRGIIDQQLLFKKTEAESDIHDSVNAITNRMNSLVMCRKSLKLPPEQKFDLVCRRCKSWAFAFVSAALTKETYHRGTHWSHHSFDKCEGNKVVVWSDAIGSSRTEERISLRYPDERDELEILWPQRRQAIIKNWGIVFDALVPQEGITIDGDQMILLYDSFLQALLGSCFALFFAKQMNKIIEDDGLKIGYKILITQSRIAKGLSLDTEALKKIKIVKPQECELLEYTQRGALREGYIIIDKEYCESNIHALEEYQELLLKTKIISNKNSHSVEVYTVNVEPVVAKFVEKI